MIRYSVVSIGSIDIETLTYRREHGNARSHIQTASFCRCLLRTTLSQLRRLLRRNWGFRW